MNCLTLKTRRGSKEAKRGKAIKHLNNRDWISLNPCILPAFLNYFCLRLFV